ncbi:alpha/beta fold hydrolase [Mycoplasmopsis felifaucium]|uniref:alpha/beta fold hydrolase n=1 Tax=Mycoplasmopsis felifaucium TaxID=35768 RepID=UPI000480CD72|nr:alpha/beta hydrolase [Mycoplasmopsis felifaucium]
MKFNYIKYQGEIIPIYTQDNKKNTTFLFLHGINSSSDFIDKIKNLQHNFNIVALNFPGSKYCTDIKPEDIKLENWINVAKEVLKNIKSKNVVIVAHSMAGGVAVELANDKRVKQVIMLSTINPSMQNNKSYGLLKSVIGQGVDGNPTFLGKLIMFGASFTKKGKRLLESFSRKGKWYNLLAGYVLNNEFMKQLDAKYRACANKLTFIIGENDNIIGTEEFTNYAQSLNCPNYILGKTHSPINDNPDVLNFFFNHFMQTKKRFWFQKFTNFQKNIIDIKTNNEADNEEINELDNILKDEEK